MPALPQASPSTGVDLVVARMVTPYLQDPAAWVHAVRTRWLRPGGHLYLMVHIQEPGNSRGGQTAPEDLARYAHGWAWHHRLDVPPFAHLVLRSPSN